MIDMKMLLFQSRNSGQSVNTTGHLPGLINSNTNDTAVINESE